MLFSPETHADNSPETWRIVKRPPRRWDLITKDGFTLHTFSTKAEAEKAKTCGFYFDLYRDEKRWLAGERVRNWKPYAPAKATREDPK